MSLIQEALEKTNRVQEVKDKRSAFLPHLDQGPMGADLEKELIRVQRSHVERKRTYRNAFIAVLLICLIAGLIYGRSRLHSSAKIAGSPAQVFVPALNPVKMPVKIDSDMIYRLTGITNMNGQAMAVINGEIVSVGDSLSGKAVVRAINQGEVRLEVDGKEIKLIL